ncbi:PREDICTED: OTU domain-containing protein At3g57810 isoform X2 [Camelina sativa]|uniref:Ubiquitin thioesterase OTU n=1 Tax=Camelina sativa TaxID=90675 RepID=A0ABM0YR81_CAMSA|nr:PREDICTED: OTU domain-containing protein At3g57810 isoform X2 [Camelina sativa]
MMICYSPVTTCSRNVIHIKRHLSTHLRGSSYKLRCHSLFSGLSRKDYAGFGVSISSSVLDKGLCGSVLINRSTVGPKEKLEVSFLSPDAKRKCSEINSNMRNLYWFSRFAYTGVVVSLLVCYSSASQSAYADASRDNSSSDGKFHNGKRVYTDYSIIGIPGDGRCLFRSVAHGFCLRSGQRAPGEKTQRELADELRTRVADEFIKRRQETEWFVEGDFDTYVRQMRKPQVWGGEPELFMASHVLQMPITVYMKDEKAGGLICIAEYGQEYGKDDPIRVLYHGFGHYDALLIHEETLELRKVTKKSD